MTENIVTTFKNGFEKILNEIDIDEKKQSDEQIIDIFKDNKLPLKSTVDMDSIRDRFEAFLTQKTSKNFDKAIKDIIDDIDIDDNDKNKYKESIQKELETIVNQRLDVNKFQDILKSRILSGFSYIFFKNIANGSDDYIKNMFEKESIPLKTYADIDSIRKVFQELKNPINDENKIKQNILTFLQNLSIYNRIEKDTLNTLENYIYSVVS